MNNHMNEVVKAGTLLRLEWGSYSEYSVMGFFVVLQSFIPEQQLEIYLSEHPKKLWGADSDPSRFLMHLLAKGLLLEISHKAWSLGSWSYDDTSIYDAYFEPDSFGF